MVQTSTRQKNLWVASSDGDLERVKFLIQNGQTANDKDSNSYTPMHAAASYAHLELLDYLLSVGGDINVVDEEGETPLFTVETMAAAQYLIAHGADAQWKNTDGQEAADFLEEDHPDIAIYLRSLSSSTSTTSDPSAPLIGTVRTIDAVEDSEMDGQGAPSALAVDNYAQDQASTLMAETQLIMEEAERTGENPDEKLREVVERAIRGGVALGGNGEEAVGGLVEQVKRRREE